MKQSLIEKLPKHTFVLNPKSYRMAHPVYSQKDVEAVKVTHRSRGSLKDKLAYGAIQLIRRSFDIVSGYNPEKMNERGWLNRIIFLESVAGVPGMIGGMQRHLRSLRTLERDHGWIHHLLQEAENERMHLFFFLKQRSPGISFRLAVALT
jgi:threonyl-tRNA synthetase